MRRQGDIKKDTQTLDNRLCEVLSHASVRLAVVALCCMLEHFAKFVKVAKFSDCCAWMFASEFQSVLVSIVFVVLIASLFDFGF